MTTFDSSSIHRHLDAVFADVPMTPEAQDLKEEIRGNLAARVSELEASGVASPAAVRKAIAELGDVREIVAQLGEGGPDGHPDSVVDAYLRNKVRPKPGFVIRTMLFSLVAAAAAADYVFSLVADGSGSAVARPPLVLAAALALGWIVVDSLRQETTTNHPLPTGRAFAYGIATTDLVIGLAVGGYAVSASFRRTAILTSVPLVVIALVAFIYLGVTQTNRKKAWVRALTRDPLAHIATQFDLEPAAAARFGMYSGALWITAICAFVALSLIVGFAWSWIAFAVAVIVQLVMLARMLFPMDRAAPRLRSR